ncbi:MAG: MerR family transcriptional regulator [Chromatiales bacterium]|nr:MerR family transcriptional regulator [Chromatiales bacterium]
MGTSNLRAWERRYGLLVPDRTPKGHRLYSERHIRDVAYILAQLGEGHSLAGIAKLLKRDHQVVDSVEDTFQQAGVWSRYIEHTLGAIENFSATRLEAVYNEASSLYPVDMVTERLMEPILERLGQRWSERQAGIAEEHFYTSWVRNRLGARFHHAGGQARGAKVIATCLPGSVHEIGLMLFSLSAMARGYRILYFGPDMPLEQLKHVVWRSAARAVVLAGHDPLSGELEGQLARLSDELEVPLLLGGPCSDEPLPRFESAGGTRLGSGVAVALKILAARIPLYAGSSRRRG